MAPADPQGRPPSRWTVDGRRLEGTSTLDPTRIPRHYKAPNLPLPDRLARLFASRGIPVRYHEVGYPLETNPLHPSHLPGDPVGLIPPPKRERITVRPLSQGVVERPLFASLTRTGKPVVFTTRRGGACVVMVDGKVLYQSGDGSLSAVKLALGAFRKAVKSI
jgi:hypothetical protein